MIGPPGMPKGVPVLEHPKKFHSTLSWGSFRLSQYDGLQSWHVSFRSFWAPDLEAPLPKWFRRTPSIPLRKSSAWHQCSIVGQDIYLQYVYTADKLYEWVCCRPCSQLRDPSVLCHVRPALCMASYPDKMLASLDPISENITLGSTMAIWPWLPTKIKGNAAISNITPDIDRI